MAIYSTFFISRPDDLPGGFPGWCLPLPGPVWREVKNPFTGEVSRVESRAPLWPEDDDESFERDYVVVTGEGSYEDYLEGRLPEFVRAQPHFAAKNLTAEIELEELAQTLGATSEFKDALFSPPSFGAMLQQLPSDFVSKLAALDPRGLETIAGRWAAVMSTPDHTHTVSGKKISDGWNVSEAQEILEPIVSIARQISADQKMYLLVEY